jgi:hypothetical protein
MIKFGFMRLGDRLFYTNGIQVANDELKEIGFSRVDLLTMNQIISAIPAKWITFWASAGSWIIFKCNALVSFMLWDSLFHF